jgi:hypothetical protein
MSQRRGPSDGYRVKGHSGNKPKTNQKQNKNKTKTNKNQSRKEKINKKKKMSEIQRAFHDL